MSKKKFASGIIFCDYSTMSFRPQGEISQTALLPSRLLENLAPGNEFYPANSPLIVAP
jgi:hypothetical protein